MQQQGPPLTLCNTLPHINSVIPQLTTTVHHVHEHNCNHANPNGNTASLACCMLTRLSPCALQLSPINDTLHLRSLCTFYVCGSLSFLLLFGLFQNNVMFHAVLANWLTPTLLIMGDIDEFLYFAKPMTVGQVGEVFILDQE